jgi:hypothetical protein
VEDPLNRREEAVVRWLLAGTSLALTLAGTVYWFT